jgi:gamma-D-glutamyl-L-lysine dipeptidyl-peptidase
MTRSGVGPRVAPVTAGLAMFVLLCAAAPATTGVACAGSANASRSPAATDHLTRSVSPPARWIAVSVATLWVKPGQERPLDAPACADPADPRAWVSAMNTTQKLWLDGRLETQALYATKVSVLAVSGGWSKVAVSGQPTPRNSRGYPGWLPTRQLTTRAPLAAASTVVIRRPTAWLWSSADLTTHVLELSYDTRLPVVSSTTTAVEVVMLDGRHLYLRRSAVALHRSGAAWPRPTAAQVLAEARAFLGLQYLWGGTSGFGFDCSGFTHSVYDALGVTIPRDAGPQAGGGGESPISKRAAARRPGLLQGFRRPHPPRRHVRRRRHDDPLAFHRPAGELCVALR